jgi:(p)ppGpp synthase/HD superfamily hydrolase
MSTNIIEKAASFAADKHKNQYRKEGGLLYISHLVSVALILQKYNFSDEVIAAGLLHDTLEDTETTEQEISENFGVEIFEIIKSVTNDKVLRWKDKKLKYLETVHAGNSEAKAVALADKIHNMKSLLINLEEIGPDKTWNYFNTSKEEKLWFEEECLKIFISKENLPKKMVSEYESLIDELKEKYF